jgi:hypothetical protein
MRYRNTVSTVTFLAARAGFVTRSTIGVTVRHPPPAAR